MESVVDDLSKSDDFFAETPGPELDTRGFVHILNSESKVIFTTSTENKSDYYNNEEKKESMRDGSKFNHRRRWVWTTIICLIIIAIITFGCVVAILACM